MKTRGLSAAAAVIVLSTVAGGLVGAQSGASQDRLNDRYEVYTKALAAVEREPGVLSSSVADALATCRARAALSHAPRGALRRPRS